ncbi:hypothetical protein LPJ56_004658, partial [Coemansia sp. RSA 2599]
MPMVSGRIPVINPFEPSSDDSDTNLNVDEAGVGGEDATHLYDGSQQQQTDHLDQSYQSDQSLQSNQSSQSLQSLQQSPPVTPEHRLGNRRQ